MASLLVLAISGCRSEQRDPAERLVKLVPGLDREFATHLAKHEVE